MKVIIIQSKFMKNPAKLGLYYQKCLLPDLDLLLLFITNILLTNNILKNNIFMFSEDLLGIMHRIPPKLLKNLIFNKINGLF